LATEVNFWIGLQRIDSEWKWTDHSKVNRSIVYVYLVFLRQLKIDRHIIFYLLRLMI